ncbi:MAG: hypothetical protein WC712_03910, partial [Candidatus Brocadiia bacterium]
ETAPDLPGNPDCTTCHGTGKVGYGKKAGDLVVISYCQFKDIGKQCTVKIAGWEPCTACEDMPGMQALFDEHEAIRRAFREEGTPYMDSIVKSKAPLPKFSFEMGKHCRIFTDYPHSKWHTFVIYTEKCWLKFSDQLEMGGEDSDWDKSWSGENKVNFFCTMGTETYEKYCEWAYNNKLLSYGTMQMGLPEIKKLGAVSLSVPTDNGNNFLGYLTHQNPEELVDERLLVDMIAGNMLEQGFNTANKEVSPFPNWLSQGLSIYYQQSVTNGISWYQVAYGMGAHGEQDPWGKFEDWRKLLGAANAVPKGSYDDKAKRWKGLIPMEMLVNFKVTNMPFQGIAQAWAMVNFMMAEGEKTKAKAQEKRMVFKEFLKAVGSGMDQVEAIQKVYGMKDLSAFETKFRSWLTSFAK